MVLLPEKNNTMSESVSCTLSNRSKNKNVQILKNNETIISLKTQRNFDFLEPPRETKISFKNRMVARNRVQHYSV